MENKYMLMAIKEAEKAFKLGEVPVGAVIVKDGVVISKAYNKKEKLKCCTKHAEVIAVEKASKKINNWRLDGCDIYVTLEPCPMCASAIRQSRISNVYCGLSRNNSENLFLVKAIFYNRGINKPCNYYCGFFENKISELLKSFFIKKRLSKKK